MHLKKKKRKSGWSWSKHRKKGNDSDEELEQVFVDILEEHEWSEYGDDDFTKGEKKTKEATEEELFQVINNHFVHLVEYLKRLSEAVLF